MVMLGVKLMGEVPFDVVYMHVQFGTYTKKTHSHIRTYIHTHACTPQGNKMSKTTGNAIGPLYTSHNSAQTQGKYTYIHTYPYTCMHTTGQEDVQDHRKRDRSSGHDLTIWHRRSPLHSSYGCDSWFGRTIGSQAYRKQQKFCE